MRKLKERWGIKSNLQAALIIIVFAINGSFATWIAKPVTNLFGLNVETTHPFIYWPLRIVLIFFIYQATLPIVGFAFGQFKFFWNFTKKTLSRMGFAFIFRR
jgi:hypothetical protein